MACWAGEIVVEEHVWAIFVQFDSRRVVVESQVRSEFMLLLTRRAVLRSAYR